MENKEKETPEETWENVRIMNAILFINDEWFEIAKLYHSERLKIEAPLLPNEYKRGFKDGEISKDQEIDRLKDEIAE